MQIPAVTARLTSLVFLISGVIAHAGNQVVPGAVQVDATFEHLGAVWWISGDDDLDSTMVLKFRQTGETEWQAAAPAVRAQPGLLVNGSPLGLNYWGASALFLSPATTYDVRLTLSDPDGGSETRIVVSNTRQLPPVSYSGRDRYVVPGSGGGTGTLADPFQGIQAAADAAQPGDVFHVGAGAYEPFQILASGTTIQPIVFSGPADGTAVVDGAGTDRGIVTLGEYNQTISWVVIEGLSMEDGHWGIDAQHSSEIVIRRNEIWDVDDGIVNRRGDALEGNQTICDNLIEGRVAWPGSGIPSERGIDLKGDGNVVCHNTVRYFGDCVSVQPSTGASFGNDVYGNDAAYCVDDGIEIDYNQANVRVWRNRVTNARMGVSVQPIRGGPAYIFRNELFNLESVPVKMHNDTTGFWVVHNTGVKHGNGYGDNGALWRNVTLRNNLFLGTRYAFEFTTVAGDGFRDFDYNGWGTSLAVGGQGAPYFKWNNIRYHRLPDLQAIGVELNGVEVAFSDLADATLPAAWAQEAIPGSRDLRLVQNAAAIDAGTDLANFNDAFSLDGAPDLGAFEYVEPLPHYGPRSADHIFADGFESGDISAWSGAAPRI